VFALANLTAAAARLNMTSYGVVGQTWLTPMSGRRGALDYLIRAVTSIPMFDGFHSLAMSLGVMLRNRNGLLYSRFYSGERLGGLTTDTMKAYTAGNKMVPTDNTDMSNVITDVELALSYLMSRGANQDATDAKNVRDTTALLRMSGVKAHPMSLNDLPTLIDDDGEVYRHLFGEAFIGFDTQGAGVGQMVSYPPATSDSSLVLRRGMGSPNQMVFAGIGPILATEARVIANTVDDTILYGMTMGGTTPSDFGVNIVGGMSLRHMFNNEDGWVETYLDADCSSVSTLRSMLANDRLISDHQWSHAIVFVNVTEEDRVGNLPVDYSFHQEIGQVAEGFRAWIANTIGLPVNG